MRNHTADEPTGGAQRIYAPLSPAAPLLLALRLRRRPLRWERNRTVCRVNPRCGGFLQLGDCNSFDTMLPARSSRNPFTFRPVSHEHCIIWSGIRPPPPHFHCAQPCGCGHIWDATMRPCHASGQGSHRLPPLGLILALPPRHHACTHLPPTGCQRRGQSPAG